MNRDISRLRAGVLHTPLLKLHNPDTNSQISLVGAVHIGRESYYRQISDYLHASEELGTEIHYERVTTPIEEEGEQSATLEQAAAISNTLSAFTELASDSLDVIRQRDGIAYSPSWQNHDITMPELVEMLPQKSIEKLTSAQEHIRSMKEELSPEDRKRLFRFMLGFTSVIESTGLPKLLGDKDLRRVIIDHRNDVALDAVKQTLSQEPSQDIALFWGAAHLPGLKKGVEALGYVQTVRYWLGAISLR